MISMTFTQEEQEIYDLTIELLHSIRIGDVEKYKALSSETLTAIEPESNGNIVKGLDFHLFFLKNTSPVDYHLELVNPVIKIHGDSAYIAYTLINSVLVEGEFELQSFNETRIYFKEDGNWKMVHFHRS